MTREELISIRETFFGQKLSQKELAAKLGVPYQTLGSWERGDRPIPKHLPALLISVGVPAERLQVNASGAPLSDIERQLIQAQAEARVWRESYYELLKRMGPVDKLKK